MSKNLPKAFITGQKQLIEEEQKKITLQIAELKESDPFSDPDHASDNAAVDTDVREQVGHDTVEAEIKDLQKRFEELKAAAQRIQKNRYGTCEKCGLDIPQVRLELVPEARYCMDCERKIKK